MILPRKSEIVM